jgi:acetyl esterase
MRRLPQTSLLSLLLTVGIAAPAARAADCPPVQVRNPEGNYIVPGVRGDIVYRRVGGRELALDAYVQRRGKRRPAVVVIHGGGFTSGSRVAFVGQFLEMLTRAGFNWFSVDYRLGGPSRAADALDDLRAALDFIRCRADEFQIDPERIALLGEDTGAQLALSLAAKNPAGVRAVVSIGGAFKLDDIVNYAAEPAPESADSGAPSLRRTAADTLVVHGAADREVPAEHASDECRRLRASGTACDFVPVEGAIHRAENWRPEQWGYKARVVRWLSRKLKLDKPDFEPYYGGLRWGSQYVGYVNEAGRTRHLKLNLYVPPGPGPFPVVILVHGGGWEAGDRVTYITPLFEPLAKAGFAWASIDYELTPRVTHETQLTHVRHAIDWVRNNAPLSRLDPDRIALVGESASGQMVAQLATEAPRGVAAVASFYGVYDFVSMAKDAGPRSIPARLFRLHKLDDETREVLRRYSPLHNAKKSMPPLLLVCGTKDGLFAQHRAFTQKLDEVGARYESFTLDGAPHGMENWEGHPEWAGYKQKLVDWLRATLRR